MHPRNPSKPAGVVRPASHTTAVPMHGAGGGKVVRDHGFPPAAAGSVHRARLGASDAREGLS
jgi:hypothetical protein